MKTIRAIAGALLVVACAAAHADSGPLPSASRPTGLATLAKSPKALTLTILNRGETSHVKLYLTASPAHYESKEVFGYMGASKDGEAEVMQDSVGLRVDAVPIAIAADGGVVLRLTVNKTRLDEMKNAKIGGHMIQLPVKTGVGSEATLVVKEGADLPVFNAVDAGKSGFQVLARLSDAQASSEDLPVLVSAK